jgi:hypothetical protein
MLKATVYVVTTMQQNINVLHTQRNIILNNEYRARFTDFQLETEYKTICTKGHIHKYIYAFLQDSW